MEIFLLEDNARWARHLIEMLEEDLKFEVTWCQNSKEALEYLDTSPNIDLGIFDIDLRGEKITGIKVAHEFDKKLNIPILFASNYVDIDAYIKEAKSYGFSMLFFKDVKQFTTVESLSGIIDEVLEYTKPAPKSDLDKFFNSKRKIGILEKTGDGYKSHLFVGKDDIMYLKSEDGYTCIYLKDRKKPILVSRNIGLIGTQINSNFYNIAKLDRATFINLEQISALDDKMLIFSDGKKIPISNAGFKQLKKWSLLITTSR